MKQVIAFLLIGVAGLAAATAMSVGEPALADIAVVQVVSQPLVDADVLAGLLE